MRWTIYATLMQTIAVAVATGAAPAQLQPMPVVMEPPERLRVQHSLEGRHGQAPQLPAELGQRPVRP